MYIIRWRDVEDCNCEGTVAIYTKEKIAKATLKKLKNLKPDFNDTYFYIQESFHDHPDPTFDEILDNYKKWSLI